MSKAAGRRYKRGWPFPAGCSFYSESRLSSWHMSGPTSRVCAGTWPCVSQRMSSIYGAVAFLSASQPQLARTSPGRFCVRQSNRAAPDAIVLNISMTQPPLCTPAGPTCWAGLRPPTAREVCEMDYSGIHVMLIVNSASQVRCVLPGLR